MGKSRKAYHKKLAAQPPSPSPSPTPSPQSLLPAPRTPSPSPSIVETDKTELAENRESCLAAVTQPRSRPGTPQADVTVNTEKTTDKDNDIRQSTETVQTKKTELDKTATKTILDKKTLRPVIIDNIRTNLTQEELKEKTHSIFKNIVDIKFLKRGGMVIFPADIATSDKLQNWRYYPDSVYGPQTYIHRTQDNNDKTDITLPWLCVNNIDTVKPEEEPEIAEKLRQKLGFDLKVLAVGIHRKIKGNLPTKLLLFKAPTQQETDALTGQKIQLYADKTKQLQTIRLYVDKRPTQCTNCYRLGHRHTHCTQDRTCVRCGKNCPLKQCTSGNIRKCINCGGSHASTHTGCPAIKTMTQHTFHIKAGTLYSDVIKRQADKNDKKTEILLEARKTDNAALRGMEEDIRKNKETIELLANIDTLSTTQQDSHQEAQDTIHDTLLNIQNQIKELSHQNTESIKLIYINIEQLKTQHKVNTDRLHNEISHLKDKINKHETHIQTMHKTILKNTKHRTKKTYKNYAEADVDSSAEE